MKLFILLLLLELVLGGAFVTTSNCTDNIPWYMEGGSNIIISPLSEKIRFSYGNAFITFDLNTVSTKCLMTNFSDRYLKIASSNVQYLTSQHDFLEMNFVTDGVLNYSDAKCISFGPNVIHLGMRNFDHTIQMWIESVRPALSCQNKSIRFSEDDTFIFTPLGYKDVPSPTSSPQHKYETYQFVGIVISSVGIVVLVLYGGVRFVLWILECQKSKTSDYSVL